MALDDEIARQLDREHIVAEMLEDAGFCSMEAAERQRTMSSMLCCDWLFQSAVLPSYVHHEYFDLLVFENLFARCGNRGFPPSWEADIQRFQPGPTLLALQEMSTTYKAFHSSRILRISEERFAKREAERKEKEEAKRNPRKKKRRMRGAKPKLANKEDLEVMTAIHKGSASAPDGRPLIRSPAAESPAIDYPTPKGSVVGGPATKVSLPGGSVAKRRPIRGYPMPEGSLSGHFAAKKSPPIGYLDSGNFILTGTGTKWTAKPISSTPHGPVAR